MDRMLGSGALIAITGYKKWISPAKGFKCPHHVMHGHGSCSDFALSAFEQFGFSEGRRQLKARFSECKKAAQQLSFRNQLSGKKYYSSSKSRKDKWSDRFCNGLIGGAGSCSPDCSF